MNKLKKLKQKKKHKNKKKLKSNLKKNKKMIFVWRRKQISIVQRFGLQVLNKSSVSQSAKKWHSNFQMRDKQFKIE